MVVISAISNISSNKIRYIWLIFVRVDDDNVGGIVKMTMLRYAFNRLYLKAFVLSIYSATLHSWTQTIFFAISKSANRWNKNITTYNIKF